MEAPGTRNEHTLNLSADEFIAAVEHQAKPLIIPLCTEIPLSSSLSSLSVFKSLHTARGFLLESIEGSEKIAQYSFVGLEPKLIVSIGDSIECEGDRAFASIAKSPQGENAVEIIKSILQRFGFVNIKAPRFFGGMIGYFAYDCIYSLSGKLHMDKPRDIEIPDAQFLLSTDCIVFDHLRKILYIFSSPLLTYDSDPLDEYLKSAAKIHAIVQQLDTIPLCDAPGIPAGTLPPSAPRYTTTMSKDEFESAVDRVKAHIQAGDIFQAVISRRIECEMGTDPFSVYQALRFVNPSPYMYYIDFGESQVIGASPEMLVRVEKGMVTTVPIAGTRLRGRTEDEDQRLAAELLADEKERAEHTMLVDLARNDLGSVCKFGSVRVNEFMGIEKFSHVQHIVSTVQGVMNENADWEHVLTSCFPAGTVSGAPKLRAMQIIDAIEPVRRGVYAGAVGYVGFNRSMEFAIAIRTILAHRNRAYVQVGAGIVADSIPENEWFETESKGEAMIKALEMAGGLQ
jgi:anthranilate synthase component 1